MYLDISSNKALPFTKQAVGAAVWNHFKGTKKHRGNYYDKSAKNLGTTADTVIEDFKMEFISNVHSLDEGKSRPFAGLGFTEKGYVVIKTPTSPTLMNGGYSVLQMCSIVVPQKVDRCAQDATTVGAFTEFALNVIVANATVSQEMIENVLLDQALDYLT
ncbi:hypothetical protein BBP00_00009872 [Phytophthora kernoviae]|uniref:Uncharacterized protein n=1 Tax=Phytophthora kernoviae TaxID=325452 RepID=A0A3F2RBD9_9STRA|nr:hypothetical protein BBP00_00009872 [Phytophthora kernoviae]